MRIVRLGDVCDVLGGKRIPKGEKLSDAATNHPYIRVSDFDGAGGVSTSSLKYVPDKVWSQISRYTISKDDVFLSIAGTIGVTGLIPDELDGANLTENACKLVIKSDLDKKYLYYFTLSTSFRSQTVAGIKQTAQPKLALARIKDIRIPLPPLEEQRRIVARLDAAFEKISAAEILTRQNLDNVSALQKSILDKYLSASDSTRTHRLADLLKICHGKDWKSLASGAIPVYGSGGFMGKYVDTVAYDKPTVLLPRKGTITNIFYLEEPFWNVDTVFYTKIDTDKLMPRYFYYFMQTVDLQALDSGSGRPSLTQTALYEIIMSVPSIAEQTATVAKLDDAFDKTRKLESEYQKKLAKLAELRQSLLAEAFSTTNTV